MGRFGIKGVYPQAREQLGIEMPGVMRQTISVAMQVPRMGDPAIPPDAVPRDLHPAPWGRADGPKHTDGSKGLPGLLRFRALLRAEFKVCADVSSDVGMENHLNQPSPLALFK